MTSPGRPAATGRPLHPPIRTRRSRRSGGMPQRDLARNLEAEIDVILLAEIFQFANPIVELLQHRFEWQIMTAGGT